METMTDNDPVQLSSGVKQLDRLLGGLRIGDNVIWYDSAGSLADVFCQNFIISTQIAAMPLIYVSFDRSPNNLLEKLGRLAENPRLIILDCFTNGKGAGAEIFLNFYERTRNTPDRQIIRVEAPQDPDQVMDALYEVHQTLSGEVRFIFESLTGMQELWGEEDQILRFYSRSCPRLYELNTIAYWVVEKNAHSRRLRAHLNKIAQVVIDLGMIRGKRALTILKAENRNLQTIDKSYHYWHKDLDVSFDFDQRAQTGINLGERLKGFRTRLGLSQAELARLVGVTASNISQIESNLIYPSLPALLRMAEILSVDVASFFQQTVTEPRVVFPGSGAIDIPVHELPKGSVSVRQLMPLDAALKAEPYIVEILPQRKLPSHFFIHRGEEMGYLMVGELNVRIGQHLHRLKNGDLIYLSDETPSQWINSGSETARLFWIKVKRR
jgi:transcriptional regulator with XRE-family HTH domain/KaiC/GvpD/RAD55 family RecA-like ATPase